MHGGGGALVSAPWAGLPCLAPGCMRPAAGEVRTLEGSPSPACEVHVLELARACPWCGSAAGAPCTVRAAHPITGRGMLLEVAPHVERLEVAR